MEDMNSPRFEDAPEDARVTGVTLLVVSNSGLHKGVGGHDPVDSRQGGYRVKLKTSINKILQEAPQNLWLFVHVVVFNSHT
jgi:hypothetical protein